MAILLTGGSGFIGKVLTAKLLQKGIKVYSLSRHPPEPADNLIPLVGDITKPNLGLEETPKDITEVFHLAGIHSLRMVDKDKEIYKTNVVGTRNVIDFCQHYAIPKIIFTSTAYTWDDLNPYGQSKTQNEKDIAGYIDKYGLNATILKPSIVMGEENIPYRGHFLRFVDMIIKLHRTPDRARRAIESALRLPLLRPLFRIPGTPNAGLNLIKVGDVVNAIANTKNEGTFWIVNNSPPTLSELAKWVGEVINVDIEFQPKFKPSLPEAIFQWKGKPFLPYLHGDDFTHLSNIKASPVDRDFIQSTIRSLLKG